MPRRDLVVIGASAGGLEALKTIVKSLSSSLKACVLIVIHTRGSDNVTLLAEILSRSSCLPVSTAVDGMTIEPGRIIVAVPDLHLLVFQNRLTVTHGPRENGFRPAIDPLFRTAARAYDSRLIGVVLSGAMDDGTYGLAVVKDEGGLAIVQDPDDAIMPNMPMSAIAHVDVDEVLPAAAIADYLNRACGESAKEEASTSETDHDLDEEVQAPGQAVDVSEMEELHGPPSGLTCPDCGGALWEIDEGTPTRYKCHVGHQFSPDSLLAEQADAVEGALWTAVRALEEQAELRSRLANRTRSAGMKTVSQGFEESAEDSHQQAQLIRRVLFELDALAAPAARVANLTSRLRPKKRRTGS